MVLSKELQKGDEAWMRNNTACRSRRKELSERDRTQQHSMTRWTPSPAASRAYIRVDAYTFYNNRHASTIIDIHHRFIPSALSTILSQKNMAVELEYSGVYIYLFGLTNVQAFIYLQAHKSAGISFFKLVIFPKTFRIFDALHLALTIHCVYYYLVTNYANFGVLAEIVWSLKVIIALLSKGRSRALPAIAFGRFAIGIPSHFILLIHYIRSSCFKDLVGIDTDSFITKLVGYIISTDICSMSIIITCTVMPTTFIFTVSNFYGILLFQVYVNSFIAFLNARYYIQANAIVDLTNCMNATASTTQNSTLKSQKDPEDEVLHVTQPIQAAMVGDWF
ncbi:hypothetical protein F4604DRAFT_1825509 [Suillus subluteus]|nr:hypothetical protein F4604DRAFT_1825509 [Suillus subluteus]